MLITGYTNPRAKTRKSTIHGTGVFATDKIEAGETIGVYGGVLVPEEEASGDCSTGLTYLFGLSDGSIIDATVEGNYTKYINHSCAPNCEAEEEETGEGLRIVIKSLIDIKKGAELFIDYSLNGEVDDPSVYRCLCGANTCRGTMLGLEEDSAVSGGQIEEQGVFEGSFDEATSSQK